MAEAKVNRTVPVVESVTLTLTPDEANYLTRFLGQTQIFTVQDLLPSVGREMQEVINDTLYNVYRALNNVEGKDY